MRKRVFAGDLLKLYFKTVGQRGVNGASLEFTTCFRMFLRAYTAPNVVDDYTSLFERRDYIYLSASGVSSLDVSGLH